MNVTGVFIGVLVLVLVVVVIVYNNWTSYKSKHAEKVNFSEWIKGKR